MGGDLLAPLAVLYHESVDVDCLLNSHLVPVLEGLGVFVVESIQLEAEDLRHLLHPVSLLDFRRLTI